MSPFTPLTPSNNPAPSQSNYRWLLHRTSLCTIFLQLNIITGHKAYTGKEEEEEEYSRELSV
jgi:hypothetical protein